MTVRGFILHPTYRIESGKPVVHLFGRLESGESFLVRDGRLAPYFFVRASDAPRAKALGAAPLAPTGGLRTLRGEEVVRVEVPTPPDTPAIRDALQAAGIPTCEADVRFAIRYLIDRGIRGAVAIDGTAAPGRPPFRVDRIFQEPDLEPADWVPAPGRLRIVSLDLETDPAGRTVYSAAIAVAGGPAEVLVALPAPAVEAAFRSAIRPEAPIVPCDDEKGLLRRLFARLLELDFDVLTGWNVIDFDLSVLAAAARRLNLPFEIGRTPGPVKVVRDTSFWGRSRGEVAGRVVLDGIDLLKGAFVKLEDYRLDTAARALLGQGKVDVGGTGDAGPGDTGSRETASGMDHARAIERAFREDLPRFVEYNLADARLVLGILERARLIELAVRRSTLTGMPLDRVGASIASFDFLYLGALRRRGFVAPTVGATGEGAEPTAGGAVLEPSPGLYGNVLAFDFKSLYPSLIRTFNIDPLGHVPEPAPEEQASLIRAPNGAFFRRETGILPEMLRVLFPQREEAKRQGDAITTHALKILMNSFYGVLATTACRFYSAPVANAITHFGHWALNFARERVELWGHRVLYGDTDSLFVAPAAGEAPDPEAALRLGANLCRRINDELRQHIESEFRVESHLELEFETLFLRFFLPQVRHGGAGARKRYAGLVAGPGGKEEMVFVGMEMVRRDWTAVSKTYQRGLFERLFRAAGGEAIAAFTRDFVAELRDGRHDDHLVYRKALRKEVDEYTATTPPHVKAARLSGQSGGVVEYVMTTAGPEPARDRKHPIDHAHYIDKQVRPIAEQVFPLVGLSFDEVVGGRSQLSLF
ncbi:MAG: DNA polymerase II [Candidatus Polarisedimenticolia bacterium]